MSVSRFGAVSLLLALAAGAMLAAWGLPAYRRALALNRIASPDALERDAGWTVLWPPGRGGPTVSPRRLHDALERAPDEALLDGAERLRAHGAWDWEAPGPAAVARELERRVERLEPGDDLIALAALKTCPLEIDPAATEPLFHRLVVDPRSSVAADALDAALAWSGPDRARSWLSAELPPGREALRRRILLALAWTRPATSGARPPPPAPLDALCFWLARTHPDDTAPLLEILAGAPDARERWAGPGAIEAVVPEVEILRHGRDQLAEARLRELAEAGDRTAAYLLLSRSQDEQATSARRVIEHPAEPPWRRRLALWRWGDPPAERVAEVLDEDVAEPGGHVFAAVLVAERFLDREGAVRRAEAWIRSFDDDEKRAGALLAALLGTHAGLLREAYEAEDVPAVHTAQRIALESMGRRVASEPAREFAYRALRKGGELDPDVALCLLAAGDAMPLDHLTELPAGGELRAAVHARAWLIERFLPTWHDLAGRPIGGDEAGLRLHFDALRGLRVLTERRLRFDRESRQFKLSAE